MAGYDYMGALRKSWDILKYNFQLIAPFLFVTVLSPLLMLLGAYGYNQGLFGNPESPNFLYSFLLAVIPMSILGFILIIFTMAGLAGMINSAVTGKKTTFWASGARNWMRLLGVSIIQMLVILLPGAVLLFIAWLISLISGSLSVVLLIIFGAIFALYVLVVGTLLSIAMVFLLPLLVNHKYSSWKLFKHLISSTKKKFKHPLFTWLLIFAFTMIASLIGQALLIPASLSENVILTFVAEGLYFIFISVVQTLMLVFTFICYYRKL